MTAPRLVLLPGLAADAAMWTGQVQGLARWLPHVSDVHMHHDGIPAMATALLQQQDGPLVLCGASMGGMVAMEAARQAPERIRGLALLGTCAHPETTEMRQLREDAIVLFAQGRVAEVIEPNVAFAFHPDNAANPTLARAYVDMVLRAGADALIRQNRAVMARPDARAHLPSLRCPVLVLCGEADRLTPPADSRAIAALVPHAHLEWVPRAGHMLTMEQPAAVNALLAPWLDDLGAA